MYSDYSSQQRDKFICEKMFFSNLYSSHFPFFFFKKLFYYSYFFFIECKLRNIYKNTCAFIVLWWNQKQPPEVLYKKAALKNFAIFAGKHLCWSLFLIKLQAYRKSGTETLGWDPGPRSLWWDPRLRPWGGTLGSDRNVCFFFNIINYTAFSLSELQEFQSYV